MESYEFRAMNSTVLLAAEGEPRNLELGFELGRAIVELYAERWTRFDETSELSRLNRSAGTWCKVSAELYDLLKEASGFVSETRGLFEPAILEALAAAGYDRSMDEIIRRQRVMPPRRGTEKWPRRSLREAEFDDENRSVLLPAGVRIDLGGIAKGWIAEEAAVAMAELTDACAVSAGGDIRMIGLPHGETKWAVEIENPLETQQAAAVLQVAPSAVATSSVAKRRWEQGGIARHHLIDPRTGEPAETDWLSVTVVAPRLTVAEVWAKALLIAGPQEADNLLSGRDDLTFLAVDRTGKLWGWRGAEELLNDGFQVNVPGRDHGRTVAHHTLDIDGLDRDASGPGSNFRAAWHPERALRS